jgi:hypothetical protein
MTDVLRFISPEGQSAGKLAELPYPPICPIGNICAASTAKAPPCGSVREHLSPLPLSEELCPDLSDRQIELEDSPRTSRGLEEQGFFLGSALTDRALGWDPGEPDAAADFDDAEARFIETAAQVTSNMETPFKSSLILAHFPLFKRRQAGHTITAANLQTLGEKLTELSERVNDYPIAASQRWGLQARIGTLLLFLRCDMLVHPGLARESQNSVPRFVGLNHSGYLLDNDSGKTPVKIGKRRSYDKRVLHVTFSQLLDNTTKHMAASDRPSSEHQGDIALAALVAEARNERVAPQHEQLLHGLSTTLRTHVDTFERKQAHRA